MKRTILMAIFAALVTMACGEVDDSNAEGWGVDDPTDPYDAALCTGEVEPAWSVGSELRGYRPYHFGFSADGARLARGSQTFEVEGGEWRESSWSDSIWALDPSWERVVRAAPHSFDAHIQSVGGHSVEATIPLDHRSVAVADARFGPDGGTVALLSCQRKEDAFTDEPVLVVWSRETGEATRYAGLDSQEPCQTWYSMERLAFGPDAQTVFVITPERGRLIRVDLETGEVRKTLAHTPIEHELVDSNPFYGRLGIVDLAVDPLAELVATSGADGTVRLWDFDTLEPVGEPIEGGSTTLDSGVHSPEYIAAPLAWSPDGRVLAMTGVDGQVELLGRDAEKLGELAREATDAPVAIRFSPDSERVAVAHSQSTTMWSCQ